MASQGRRTDPSLKDLLFSRAYDFKFFQAVRLMERLYQDRSPKGVGLDARPADEPVRFRAHRSMEFPASQIRQIQEPASDSSPAKMTVAFMGLTGPVGVLPWHYTELLIELDATRNSALEEFFDLFNHRMISLFYRAWEKHRFFISYEKNPAGDQESGCDVFTQYLFDLIGMGTSGLRNRLSFPDHALLRYAGLIAQRPHSTSALQGILSDYFSIPVEIHPFRGSWFALDDTGLSRLGEDHSQLGTDAIAGDAVWNPQARIGIQVGPVSIDRFVDFLPDGKAFRALKDWVQFFIGRAIEFELQLVLHASEVPQSCLSDEGSTAPRLGWMSWLKTEEFAEDARQAVFSGEERFASA